MPIHKALKVVLPLDRPYTELEAMFSVAIDYDQGQAATIAGYAALWGWSRGKVQRFMDRVGITIVYPQETAKTQNQRGQIAVQKPDRNRAETGQIKFIDSKWLSEEAGRKRADNEQKASRSQSTTKKPEPEPNPNPKISPPDWVPLTAWNAFLESRAKNGKVPTKHAVQLLIGKLYEFRCAGYDVAAILNNSTMNGWTGLFLPKEEKHGAIKKPPKFDDHATASFCNQNQLL